MMTNTVFFDTLSPPCVSTFSWIALADYMLFLAVMCWAMQETTADYCCLDRNSASFFLMMLLHLRFDKFFIRSRTSYTLTPKRSATSYYDKVRFEVIVMILRRVAELS